MAGLLDDFADYMVKQSIDRTDPKKPPVPLSSQVLSALQGASNAAASNLSAPVDGIAWLLRKAGVPIPSNPVGGSDWMAQQGLTREPQNRNMGLLGEAIGGVLPMVAAAKAPQIAKGLLQVEANAMAPRTLNKETGAIVWHGSPHKFDKFDASKIGTGEGAQAYGHGIYMAESPITAKAYQTSTAAKDSVKLTPKFSQDFWDKFDVPPADVRATAQQLIQQEAFSPGHIKQLADDDSYMGIVAKNIIEGGIESPHGNLYKVDLPDEHIAKMLDWDKPLSQQAPAVRDALAKSGDKTILGALNDAPKPINGGEYWQYRGNTYDSQREALADATGAEIAFGRTGLGNSPAEVSKRLSDLGIPGIRYLDGGSRGTGAGTSNFVVFPGNENLLKILERNGQGLLGN